MYYVYTHSIDGKVFYVGKGKGSRANCFGTRSIKWHEIVKLNFDLVVVDIVKHFKDEESAFAFEAVLIGGYRPKANIQKISACYDPINSMSDKNPNQPVSDCSPMSLRINDYQKDVIKHAAAKQNISTQAWIRKTLIEAAKEQGVF